MIAACERDLPLFVPGWEDSTLGNMFAAACLQGRVQRPQTMKSGVEYMMRLASVPGDRARAADRLLPDRRRHRRRLPICVVPMMHQDMQLPDIPVWAYFCQISDSTTSYGSYSGAVPNEKITWGKLAEDTPKFIIESDATIVAPLIFAWVLGGDRVASSNQVRTTIRFRFGFRFRGARRVRGERVRGRAIFGDVGRGSSVEVLETQNRQSGNLPTAAAVAVAAIACGLRSPAGDGWSRGRRPRVTSGAPPENRRDAFSRTERTSVDGNGSGRGRGSGLGRCRVAPRVEWPPDAGRRHP